MDVTAILLNYKRPREMARLVESLKGQSVPVRIMMGDNAEEPFPRPKDVDAYARLSWNGACYLRLFLAFYADTEYVMYMDDDRKPKDSHFVRDALAVAREHPGGITGAAGRRFSRTPPHYHSDVWGPAEIIKGFALLFERSILSKVPVSPAFVREWDFLHRSDDIHLSLMTGLGRPAHWAERTLLDRLEDHDRLDVGFTAHPRHNEIREAIAAEYVGILERMGALT